MFKKKRSWDCNLMVIDAKYIAVLPVSLLLECMEQPGFELAGPSSSARTTGCRLYLEVDQTYIFLGSQQNSTVKLNERFVHEH